MTWPFPWLDTSIVITGALCAMASALVGCFLVLRRMSLMGDAISHAVLPGLAVAFLLTGSRANIVMFIGAAIVGILTALLTQWIHSLGKVESTSATGVVFTALFAIGLVLIVRAADAIDLDPGCVLYGALELSPLDTVHVLGFDVPRASLVLGIVLVINAVTIGVFYKEFKISAFDPALATTMGINASLMHYLLMAMVAVTAVASFESVGSILVIAMLVVPAATAHLLTDRLSVMILLSVALAAASAVLGHVGAVTLPKLAGFEDTNTAGMMALTSGVFFLAAATLAPRYGLMSRVIQHVRGSLRVVRQDVLAALYRKEETAPLGGATHVREPEGSRLLRWIVERRLVMRGMLLREGDRWRLAPEARREAESIVRSHRLWESYLTLHSPAVEDEFHPAAERLEHVTDAQMQSRLSSEAADPRIDPQGKSIPPGTPK